MARKTKAEIAVLAGLTLVAMAGWSYFGRSAMSSAHAAAPAAARYKAMGVENPQIHWDRLDEAQQTAYEATGRDIFTGGSLTPPFHSPSMSLSRPLPRRRHRRVCH
jgi:hypothetical protein